MSPKKNGELELENTGRSKDIVKCHTERLKKKVKNMSERSSNIKGRLWKSNLSLNRGSEGENIKNGGKVISIGVVNT